MSEANEKQIGGDHYKADYQHWDWVVETNQGYLMGCATKYITRHRNKNGVQDLEKCIHYLQKLGEWIDTNNLTPRTVPECARLTEYFIEKNNIEREDADILRNIIDGNISVAIGLVTRLIPKH